MQREDHDAEKLFDRLAEIAAEEGFILDEGRLSGRPTPHRRTLSEYRIRSLNYVDRLPSASVVDAIFGD